MKHGFYFFLPMLIFSWLVAGNLPAKNDLPVFDGPYVVYANGQMQVTYLLQGDSIVIKTDSVAETAKAGFEFKVNTDLPDVQFPVRIKSSLQNEEAEYKKPSKLFVLSDIEGNFGALRQLLQAGGVIDSSFNWTFGDGHVVMTGDFFDRGTQVTEVLWLIYSLEEKAKAAGGYVHFILGNHEIMNLSNDIRYVHQKYINAAAMLNTSYQSLYDEHSELGRWLRTKNIMEKIGDKLFVHGGISSDMNIIDLSIPKINQLSRPHYADSNYQYSDPVLELIFTDNGPFWYRGYYKASPLADMSQIDSTLDRYKVKQIFTGHTVVADTISSWYDGKVINTDVHHASGKSEAILIEEGNYYRINQKGEKHLFLRRKR